MERIFDTGGTSSHTPWRLEYLGPVILLVDGFVDEVAAACMIPIVIIVNLMHHFLYFVRSKTPHIRVRMELEVGLHIQVIPRVCILWRSAKAFVL